MTCCDTGDKEKDGPVLASTVQSVLAAAADHGMQSVAMPLMGSGRAGWPVTLAAHIHSAEVLDFIQSGKAGSMVRLNTALLAAYKQL